MDTPEPKLIGPADVLFGRLLIDVGHALVSGRMHLGKEFAGISEPPSLVRTLSTHALQQMDTAVDGPTDHPESTHGEDLPAWLRVAHTTRPKFPSRKGYVLAKTTKTKKPDLTGITPAGVKILQWVAKHPRSSAQDLADALHFSRKTVENLCSLLRQRGFLESISLKGR